MRRVWRWVAPDGRKGRWERSVEAAHRGAIKAARAGRPNRTEPDAAQARTLWAGLERQGWRIVRQGLPA